MITAFASFDLAFVITRYLLSRDTCYYGGFGIRGDSTCLSGSCCGERLVWLSCFVFSENIARHHLVLLVLH